MKNLYLCITVATLSLHASQPGPFELQVSLHHGIKTGKAYLQYFSAKGRHLDSVAFNDGTFIFKGTLPKDLIRAKLYVLDSGKTNPTPENSCDVLLEPETIRVEAEQDLVHNTCSGSEWQEQFSGLQKQLLPFRKQQSVIDTAFREALAAADDAGKDRLLGEDYPALFKSKQKIIGQFITSHPASMVSALFFEAFAGDEDLDLSVVEPVYAQLTAPLKNLPELKKIKALMEVARQTAIGMDAPEFMQPDTAGREVRLSSFKGKFVLLDFWAGWCAPCRAENPMLRKIYTAWHDRGLEIISISLDGDRTSWTTAIANDEMSWTQVSDLKVFGNAACMQFGITSIPQNILIGRDGKILAKNVTLTALNKKCVELMP